MSEQSTTQGHTGNNNDGRTVIDWLEVAGDQLVVTVKQLLKDTSVRRIILRDSKGKELFSVPMNAGLAVGGVAVLAAPVVAALGVVAAMVTNVTIEVERIDTGAADTGSGDEGEAPLQGDVTNR